MQLNFFTAKNTTGVRLTQVHIFLYTLCVLYSEVFFMHVSLIFTKEAICRKRLLKLATFHLLLATCHPATLPLASSLIAISRHNRFAGHDTSSEYDSSHHRPSIGANIP